MKNNISILVFISAIAFMNVMVSCNKVDGDQTGEPQIQNINDLNIPDGFDFKTVNEIDFTITTLSNKDVALSNVRIDILTDFAENGGVRLSSGVTNASGVFSVKHFLPAYSTKVVIATKFLGLPSETEVSISNNQVNVILGGSQGQNFKSGAIPFKSVNSIFFPMGDYTSSGVPLYLEPENDIIDPAFLNDINASFPEQQPVPMYNPNYLDPDNEYDFKLLEASDVWVTFIHEGAGYRNVLGYYTYNMDNPPASPDQIDTIRIIFPNVSFSGSGGGLVSGNKVYLGQFQPNTAIGWVLIANGFSGGNITNGNGIYFSNPLLNPEANPLKKQHAVHLFDNGRDLFILGFEDLNRTANSDDDFNDALFYVTANPIQAVDLTGFETITYTSSDIDNDGVSDQFDEYPEDPQRAFNNFYPSENGFGTLAFEDLWPAKGDYDFNDMVIDYNINQVTNGSNQVVEILASFTLRAMGASFKNGFGFQLPLPSEDIENVSGQQLFDGLITLNSNNTEANQENAVIIVFDNGYKVMPYPGNGIGINTDPNANYVDPQTIEIIIALQEPTPVTNIGLPPYNPFIFTNQQRSSEIHLVDHLPTNLADYTLFGTFHDNTDPEQNSYYKTTNNLPWAIHIVDSFDYPVEKAQIIQGYLLMSSWAESAGQIHSDWHKDLPGYRNADYIFIR